MQILHQNAEKTQKKDKNKNETAAIAAYGCKATKSGYNNQKQQRTATIQLKREEEKTVAKYLLTYEDGNTVVMLGKEITQRKDMYSDNLSVQKHDFAEKLVLHNWLAEGILSDANLLCNEYGDTEPVLARASIDPEMHARYDAEVADVAKKIDVEKK